MKQKKTSQTFVKIFESTESGVPINKIITDFANVRVDPNDDLPHIICTQCFENLIKCREFQNVVVQNATNLANLAKKSPNEIEKIIAEPLVRIEKVQHHTKQSNIVKLVDTEDAVTDRLDDQFESQSSSSEDEDEFGQDEDMQVAPIEAVSPRISCCCCALQFSEEHEIIQHMKTEHSAIRSKLNIQPVDKDPKDVIQCELCFKYVVGMDRLLEHQTQYKNCKQCVECGGFYQNKT
jgi:Zinc-finger associated domain (zf-AD)